MDANRFDQFTRSLSGALSRRSTLSLALSGGISSLLGIADMEAKKKGKKRKKHKKKGKGKPKGAQCRTSHAAGNATTTISFKQGALTLTNVDATPNDPREPRSSSMTIREKGDLLVETHHTVDGSGSIAVRVTYGKLFQGVNEALLTVAGGMVSGTIDGRALVPFPATETPETFPFQDGQPAPETTVNRKLLDGMKKLMNQAAAKRPSCAAAAGRGSRTGQPRAGNDFKCLACKAGCAWDELVCGNGVKGTCGAAAGIPFLGGLAYPACIAIGLIRCVDNGVECLQDCRHNKDCCPVQCGTLFDLSCCEANQQCLTFGTGLGQCCAPGETACHEKECCKPGETCLPGGICCRGPVCGDNCCGAFAFCCGGQCCSGSCNGNICCPADQSSCGSGCCANVCCNGDCCGPDQICENGQCKTPTTCAFICNGQCCQQGDVCCGDFECRPLHACPK
jgi:hypothetical protein